MLSSHSLCFSKTPKGLTKYLPEHTAFPSTDIPFSNITGVILVVRTDSFIVLATRIVGNNSEVQLFLLTGKGL